MGAKHDVQCFNCGKWEVETFDDDGPDSLYCSNCNDRMAERHRERREWDHYHPSDKK